MKKFTIFSLISVGVSFVIFLFFGTANPSVNSFEIAGSGSGGRHAQKQPTNGFGKLVSGVSEVLGISYSENGNNELQPQASDPSNFTEIFAKLIGNKLIEGNPQGVQQIGGEDSLVIPGDLNLADPNLRQKFELFRDEIFSPIPIDESKLHIVDTTKPEDLKKYFLTLESEYFKLYENNGFVTDMQSAADTLKNFEVFEKVFTSYLNILYTMEVPTVFKEFHLKAIRATAAEVKINKAVLNYQRDPLKAMWMKNLQNELTVQVKNITKEEIALMKKYDISLK